MNVYKVVVLLCLSLFGLPVLAAISVYDDLNQAVNVSQPVKRIVSLAPHATELLFAAGAIDQIVATVSFSDYPEAAKKLPRIGGYKKIDMEQLVAAQPDLIMVWPDGNPQPLIDELKQKGYRLYYSEPGDFEGVARSMRALGKLLGTVAVADQRAQQFLDEYERLKLKYPPTLKKVDVFYQVWNQPLMTINHKHLISRVIEFCGGINVFGELPMLAPRVDIEAVMAKDPDVIVAGMAEGREDWLQEWLKWPVLKAVKQGHVYSIDAELIVRQTPRIVQGAEKMCEHLNHVREK
ncbi:MAG: cobalamin-binding protein [Gammaproteobacteria bacterium]|nr:cobalamin-binding protein [Gammaproteobacteria bacterium]